MMHTWKWARTVGGKRALWRLKYKMLQGVTQVASGGSRWPEPCQYVSREQWSGDLEDTWPGQIAQRVRTGEASRMIAPLLDRTTRDSLLDRTTALVERGTWHLYEALRCELGAPIDWLCHPDGRQDRWPLTASSRALARKEAPGDIKDVWEVGRVSWTGDLVRQRALDEDQRTWATWFSLQVRHFIAQHHESYLGPHFASGQECAIRAMRWCLLGAVLLEDEGLDDESIRQLQRVLYAHGIWIARHIDFALYAVPNNHVIAEALALWMLATCMPWLEQSSAWRARARHILHHEVPQQFSPDGGYTQASHNSHRFARELLAWWWAMSADDPESRAVITQLVTSGAAHLRDCMMDFERGLLPNFGANDGAHFHQFCDAEYEDFRPLLAMLAPIISAKQDPITAAHPASQEAAYWLHGALPPRAPSLARANVRVWGDKLNGFNGLRDGSWQVALRAGTLWGTASQVDFGHVEVWHGERCIACDRGSLRYHDPVLFESYAGLTGHNVLAWEGVDFAVERVGRFLLGQRRWESDVTRSPGRLAWLHDGWREVVRGRSLREVVVTPEAVIVRDQMRMRRQTTGVLRWQFACEEVMVDEGALCMIVDGVRVRVEVRGAQVLGLEHSSDARARRYATTLPMVSTVVRFVARPGELCEVRTIFEVS